MEPVLKWAGGKRKLINAVGKYIKLEEGERYFEPFFGGGAILFGLEIKNAVINDTNSELINVYEVIRDNPDELIKELKTLKKNYSTEYYYQIRNKDRESSFNKLSKTKKAARIIFLNKTCYNGLYRVNSKGQFNVPVGRYNNPEIVMEDRIRSISLLLNNGHIDIRNGDFEACVCDAKRGDVIYFDPPYDYENNGFTSYSATGFTRKDLIRLKELCDDLIARGCKVIVSNNDTSFVNKLFEGKEYSIERLDVSRFIGSKTSSRKRVKEVIIYGHN